MTNNNNIIDYHIALCTFTHIYNVMRERNVYSSFIFVNIFSAGMNGHIIDTAPPLVRSGKLSSIERSQ